MDDMNSNERGKEEELADNNSLIKINYQDLDYRKKY
ncbi:MAG: hypothetical protein K0S47_2746 [Herbinix sp.]|jgi:hypothetical protein|nr:hypothetical protein [Herbinix sp.]